MQLTLLERDNVAAVWATAFVLFLVADGMYLTVARQAGLYKALEPQKDWYIFFVAYLILAATLVTVVDAAAAVGAAIGFTIFAIYNLTTLATTEYDEVSALCDIAYGTSIYSLSFFVADAVEHNI